MNKLTKVGFSALCGSLATISSANAGDMTVTGGVDMSWISLEKLKLKQNHTFAHGTTMLYHFCDFEIVSFKFISCY